MLQPFIWMFKTEHFKEHVGYLLSVTYGAILIAGILVYIANYFKTYSIFLTILAVIIYILSNLCIQGYFWFLVCNIAERKINIESAEIYNGKIKKVIQIELPEINTASFIWRGIAAIVANILLFYPLVTLLIIPALLSGLAMDSVIAGGITYIVLYAFIGLFIPALLWNYAVRNSIVAVWNIPKAIHILGSYTGRYLWNTFLFLLLTVVTKTIISCVQLGLGLYNFTPEMLYDTFYITKLSVFLLILPIISIIEIYINAYLLGTIAPPSEI